MLNRDIQLIYMSVKILRFWGLLYEKNWRRYLCLSLTTFLVFSQCVYMLRTTESFDAVIRNSYMLVLWFNTILRAYLLLMDQYKYEGLIGNLESYFIEFLLSNDSYIQFLLTEVNSKGKIMAHANLFLGLLTCIGFGCYPIFSTERVLPFGSMIPGINECSSPFYEIIYTYQMIITPMGCCMYIPFTSLIVAFIMFGIVMCKALQHRVRCLRHKNLTKSETKLEINECIKYHNRIISYLQTVNSLTTFIFLMEFLAFGTLLCALLFLLIIVDSTAEILIVIAYITMILAQILAFYWYANELREQSLSIATAVYNTDWFEFEIPVQKSILLMIMRSQKPSSIMVGNIRPMTLELFQALLNTSYSYFTLFKRVYTT